MSQVIAVPCWPRAANCDTCGCPLSCGSWLFFHGHLGYSGTSCMPTRMLYRMQRRQNHLCHAGRLCAYQSTSKCSDAYSRTQTVAILYYKLLLFAVSNNNLSLHRALWIIIHIYIWCGMVLFFVQTYAINLISRWEYRDSRTWCDLVGGQRLEL